MVFPGRVLFGGEENVEYVIVGGACVASCFLLFVFRRSAGYRAVLAKLENENALLAQRVGVLDEECQHIQQRVGVLRGEVEVYEQAENAREMLYNDITRKQKKAKAEPFPDFLVRTGVIKAEQLAKVRAYKEKSGCRNAEEEVLVMLDYISVAGMTEAKRRYEDACNGEESSVINPELAVRGTGLAADGEEGGESLLLGASAFSSPDAGEDLPTEKN